MVPEHVTRCAFLLGTHTQRGIAGSQDLLGLALVDTFFFCWDNGPHFRSPSAQKQPRPFPSSRPLSAAGAPRVSPCGLWLLHAVGP